MDPHKQPHLNGNLHKQTLKHDFVNICFRLHRFFSTVEYPETYLVVSQTGRVTYLLLKTCFFRTFDPFKREEEKKKLIAKQRKLFKWLFVNCTAYFIYISSIICNLSSVFSLHVWNFNRRSACMIKMNAWERCFRCKLTPASRQRWNSTSRGLPINRC